MMHHFTLHQFSPNVVQMPELSSTQIMLKMSFTFFFKDLLSLKQPELCTLYVCDLQYSG